MSLIVLKSINELPEKVKKRSFNYYFENRDQIQSRFCSLIEHETENSKYPEEDENDEYFRFLESDEVKAYLSGFGVRKKENFIYHFDDINTDHFVTYINYPLQLACIALHRKEIPVILTNQSLIYGCYLAPILDRVDVYLVLDSSFFDIEANIIGEVAEAGGEVIINGISSKDFSDENKFILYLYELRDSVSWLTKKLDAEIYGNYEKESGEMGIVSPYECTLAEYVRNHEQKAGLSDWHSELSEEYQNFRVSVNGANIFSGTYRRYPLYWLFKRLDKWYFSNRNSVKNPYFAELIEDALLDPRPFDFEKLKEYEVSDADVIFVMVLNCDEICDCTKYWEKICFMAKLDKRTKHIEICDKTKAVPEFHELLQKSETL